MVAQMGVHWSRQPAPLFLLGMLVRLWYSQTNHWTLCWSAETRFFFETYLGLNIFNVSEGCRLESSAFSLYIPETVTSQELVFQAIEIPAELLKGNIGKDWSMLTANDHADLSNTLRQLKPAITLLENHRRTPVEWPTPDIVSTSLSVAAICGVLLLASLCLYAGRTTTAAADY